MSDIYACARCRFAKLYSTFNLHLLGSCHNHWCPMRLLHLCQKSTSGRFALALTASPTVSQGKSPLAGYTSLSAATAHLAPLAGLISNDFQCRCQFPRSSSWTYAIIRCSHAYLFMIISISTLHTIFGNKSTVHHGTLSYARTYGPFLPATRSLSRTFFGFGVRADFPLKQRSRSVI